jgi:trigger factor
MNSVIEEINSVQRRIKVSVPGDIVTKAFNAAYVRLQKKAKVSGFRPGKVPLQMIKKMYGNSVASEVVDDLINQNLFAEITKSALRPVAPPMIEQIKDPVPDTEFVFTAVLDVMPEIKLTNYKGLEVTVKNVKFEQSLVDRELELMARRNGKSREITDANAKAEKGHVIEVSHKVSVDGKLMDSMAVDKMPLNLGIDEIHPELESAMVGLKAGESKKVDITLPENFEIAELAGKRAEFEIVVNSISALDTPKIDDEFAKDLHFESKEALETKIRENLQSGIDAQNKREIDQVILNALREKNAFEVPPAMVDEVIDNMIKEAVNGDAAKAKDAAKNESVRKNFRDQAKLRVQNSLLLWELAKIEEIKVENSEIEDHIKRTLGETGDQAKSKSVVDKVIKQVGKQIEQNLLLEKALDLLKSSAKISVVY